MMNFSQPFIWLNYQYLHLSSTNSIVAQLFYLIHKGLMNERTTR
jgi:hypothetical protein